ncbi:MAG TPA: PKD domain-containing protein [Gammaproteobacteria bacterium]|nr:PKD domain-containing protein [Gammaproteobacteria bacterium]
MHRNRFMNRAALSLHVLTGVCLASINRSLAVRNRTNSLCSLTLLGLALGGVLLWAPAAFAYSTWSGGCQNCHGGFKAGNYTSMSSDDPAPWGQNLMDGHVSQFALGCSDCHSGGSFKPVTLDVSNSGVTCSSCHGRSEDDAAAGLGGSMPSAGLRQHHYNAGVQVCAGCHAADANPATFTPVGEDVPSPTFIVKGIDPCNDVAFGSLGLDNDGDGPRDAADSDCQAPVDNPPTAVISAPASGLVGETLTFDGSASSDDGTIVSYTWDFGDGVSASGMATTHAYGSAGTYTVSLAVCDDATPSQCSTANHTLTINDVVVDNPPIAAISGPSSGTVGDTLSFDGSGSTDDGAIVSYVWTVDGMAAGSGMSLSWLFSTAGSFNLALTVCDNASPSQCDTATHAVMIRDVVVDNPPTAVISAPANGLVGETLSFDGSASSDDGMIISYAWDFGDGTSASGMTASHAYGSAGTYTVSLQVCDDASPSQCATASHTVTISDLPVDKPPSAVISGPSSGSVSETLSFDGSGSTDDGRIVSYAWTVDGMAVGSGMSLSWRFDNAGSFSVALTVCDDAAQCDTASHAVVIRQPAAGGEALYMNHCAACHGDPTSDEPAPEEGVIKVAGARTCSIQGAIYGTARYPDGVDTMRYLQGLLSDEQIREIADYLNALSVTGRQRYVSACSGCHGQDVDEELGGSDAGDIGEAIHEERQMRFLRCLPDDDIQQIGQYLGAKDGDHEEDDDKDREHEDEDKDKKDKDDHKRHDDDKEHRESHD